jgi:predicted nucleic acid-binding protein
LTIYLDTSVVASLFTTDTHSVRAAAWLPAVSNRLALSEWTIAEFSSALAVMERALRLPANERARAEAAFDSWVSRQRSPHPLGPGDAIAARRFILGITRPLRAAAALHLALVQRLGLSLATFDDRMAAAAADLGIPVEDL